MYCLVELPFNPILLVIPILSLLMFELGLTLRLDDFRLIGREPRGVIAGLLGQIVVLPLIAFAIAWAFGLDSLWMIGLVLIACSPGGSSSNIFSMLAGGDVALSVTLTAASSIITLFTIPVVMAVAGIVAGSDTAVTLPIGNLFVQNIVLMLVPILLGVGVRRLWPRFAGKADAVLRRTAFPALMLLAGIFFIQHYTTITTHFAALGGSVVALLAAAMAAGWLLSRLFRLEKRQQRTIIIEVGMQNAAQAIAVATSPFVFNEPLIATPAIIYALLMNVFLLTYVAIVRRR